jgi:hypothetical protein
MDARISEMKKRYSSDLKAVRMGLRSAWNSLCSAESQVNAHAATIPAARRKSVSRRFLMSFLCRTIHFCLEFLRPSAGIFVP